MTLGDEVKKYLEMKPKVCIRHNDELGYWVYSVEMLEIEPGFWLESFETLEEATRFIEQNELEEL